MDLPPPLPRREISRLIRRYKRGDKLAGDKVIEHNLRFCKRYAESCAVHCAHLKPDDLFQEAVLGMKMALDRFRCRKNTAFLTYAKHWIRQKVMRAIRQNEHEIRVPENLQRDMKLGKSKRYSQLATESRRMLYLDACPTTDEGEEIEGGNHNVLPDSHTAFDDRQSISHINYLIKTGLRELNKRERDIIKRRFGLVGGNDPLTLKEVGERHNLSRERIRQVEDIALQKLRKALEQAA